jgi:hypothetical protein
MMDGIAGILVYRVVLVSRASCDIVKLFAISGYEKAQTLGGSRLEDLDWGNYTAL